MKNCLLKFYQTLKYKKKQCLQIIGHANICHTIITQRKHLGSSFILMNGCTSKVHLSGNEQFYHTKFYCVLMI